jgi:hypothetical protein
MTDGKDGTRHGEWREKCGAMTLAHRLADGYGNNRVLKFSPDGRCLF